MVNIFFIILLFLFITKVFSSLNMAAISMFPYILLISIILLDCSETVISAVISSFFKDSTLTSSILSFNISLNNSLIFSSLSSLSSVFFKISLISESILKNERFGFSLSNRVIKWLSILQFRITAFRLFSLNIFIYWLCSFSLFT